MTMHDLPKHVLACRAGYGSGGLGQHFSHVVEEKRREGGDVIYLTRRPKPGDPAGVTIRNPWAPLFLRYTPLRWSPGGSDYLDNDRFDRAAARQLSGPMASYTGFGGQSLHSFRRARELGCPTLRLLAANSHVENVRRQHEAAFRRWPLETSWLNDAQRMKTLAEYQMADEVLIASEYARQTFLAASVPDSTLRRTHYPVDPRFHRGAGQTIPNDGVFRIVYIGSVTIFKGIPLLLEAFARLKHPKAQLTLVGGTASRGMRRYIEDWLRRDARIRLAPGDPLPHLLRANVCVHPSFEDNLAYACIEAIACGVPLIVSDHTGAKEYVSEGVNGWIVPTGNRDALIHRLQAVADAVVA